MKYLITLGTFLTLFGFQSCTKDSNIKTDIQRLWDCNASQHYDSTKLAGKLIGSWQWSEMSSEGVSKPKDKNVTVTFTSGKFSVAENFTVVTRGNWQLKKVDNDILGLSMDTPSVFLYGRILICDDEVLFNDSYIDGADNFFSRIK
jgi:hypothetical protein